MTNNTIHKTNFHGRIKFDKKLSKDKIKLINKVLDYKVNGTTARERIKKSTYDVEIKNIGSKKEVRPKALFVSYFKTLNNPDKHYKSQRFTFNKIEETNAKLLQNWLDKFETMKNNYYYSYNSLGEKIKAYYNKISHIVFGFKNVF